jgi:glucose-1-phosphate thymidylyltransferase|tara:strand:- start:1132 stop:1866 length:735 start_codon:yes stop_codon:yes gene_type:complete
MKGIVLAGGLGTRLRPLTYATNKHLLPVYNKPMVYHPIETLVNAGITDILIVTGGPHAGDFIKVLRNGEDFGLSNLNYAYQEGEGGIADALAQAETFVGGDNCTVILGDNLIFEDLTPAISSFKSGAKIFTKTVPDPERFGVVEYEPVGDGISRIVEKPEIPPSSDAVTGVYIYDSTVFDKVRTLSPSERGELEITDINNFYVEDGDISVYKIQGTWMDCGTFDSLAKATEVMYNDTHVFEEVV